MQSTIATRGRTAWSGPRRTMGSGVPVLAAVLAVLLAPAAVAAEPNTCASGKTKCTSTFLTAALKCYVPIAKKGLTAATSDKGEECVRKARQKFGTSVASSPGCFDKVEAKQKPTKPETLCPPGADKYDLDAIVEDVTLEIVTQRVLPTGAPFGSSCDAGKLKCVAALLKGLFACQEKALKKGLPVDPACVVKATQKFDGGPNPAKGCFAKLEAKQKITKIATLCDPGADSSPVVGGFVDATVADAVDSILK